MAKKKPDHSVLITKLEERAELERRIEAKNAEISDAHGTVNGLLAQLREKQNALKGYESACERNGQTRFMADMEEAKEAVDSLSAELEKAEGRQEQLTAELDELREELAALDSESPVSAIVAHQTRLNELRTKVADIEAALDAEKALLDEAEEFDDPVVALERENRDLLARARLGEADERELAALDEKIAEKLPERSAIKAAHKKKLALAQQTISGLDSRLAQATEELDRLNDLTPQVLRHHLRAEAEDIGKEYAATAPMLIDQIRRLMAIDQALQTLGLPERESVAPVTSFRTHLPCFSLKSCEDLSQASKHGVLFAARGESGAGNTWLSEAILAERKRLEKLGVDPSLTELLR